MKQPLSDVDRNRKAQGLCYNSSSQIPNIDASTTADPKPKDIGGNETPDRIEANEDYWSLRDEGRNPDGSGMSYGERNL